MDQRPETSMRLPGSGSGSPYYMSQAPPPQPEAMAPLHNSPSLSPFQNPPYPLGNMSGPTLPMDGSTRSIHAPNVLLQGEPVRRKRGRPRKYGHDAAVSLALSTTSMSGSVPVMRAGPRKRGRPPGSSRNKPVGPSSLGTAMNLPNASLFNGAGTMTPHIINVAAGEDIKRRILSLLRGRGAIVVLSGVGSVSAANLGISGSGGSVTYEGQFNILSLSGSYVNDVDAPHGPTGGLNVTLSGPDGRVTGGPVEAVLIAASVVQVIVGSLLPRTSSKPRTKAVEEPQPRASINMGGGDSSNSANIQTHNSMSNHPMGSWQSTQ